MMRKFSSIGKRKMAPYLKNDAFYVAAPAFIWQLLFFYAPFFLMVAMSIVHRVRDSWALSLNNYEHFFNGVYFLIILKSLIFAGVTGLLCFLVGYPLAYFIAFTARRYKLLLLFMLIIPFWTNFLLHVYSWFLLLDKAGIINNALLWSGIIHEPLELINSLGSVLILMVYCYLLFMVLPIYSSLERINPRLIEASRDLGATQFETWYHVILPLSMGGIMAGFFLVFIPAYGEFAIPGLMGGDKFVFVGSVITYYALGSGTLNYGSAFTVFALICLLVFLLIAAAVKWAVLRFWWRKA